jgi:hypothetical protein
VADERDYFERYARYRFRLGELIDLWELTAAAKKQPELASRVPTINLAMATWLASIMDEKALQVIPVWKKLFPSMVPRIRHVERKHKKKIAEIIEFRHKTGAHATRLEEQSRVRVAAARGMGRFIDDFLEIAIAIVRLEETVPGLAADMKLWHLPPGKLNY